MTTFTLNGEPVSVDAAADTPLLWVLRERLRMAGTKFGCGAGLCGACTVLTNGRAVRSCMLPLSKVEGVSVTTIEGLGGDNPVQRAWVEVGVPQCGYCQSGQILSTVSLLSRNPNPTDDEIKTALAGNLCRCGSYQEILQAARRAADTIRVDVGQDTPEEGP